MLATITMLSLVATSRLKQDGASGSLFQSLESVASKIPYVDPNTATGSAKFHNLNLKPSQFVFGKDKVIAFRFDAVPDAGRRVLALGFKVPGIKAWGVWSRRGPEDLLEQFEEVKTGTGLVVGQTKLGALVGSREYVVWFRTKADGPTTVPVSINMYTQEQMQTAVIEQPDRFALLRTEQDEADETDPWDQAMTAQTKVDPVASIGPLPALDESHLLFDTESTPSFSWSPFEYATRRYVSLTVDLGSGLMDQHVDIFAFGGEYDQWGYDTRAAVPMGIYSWGYLANVLASPSLDGEKLLASEVLGVRAVVPLRSEKHSGTMVIWFRLKGDQPPRRVMLFYQDDRKRLRDLLGTLPSLG